MINEEQEAEVASRNAAEMYLSKVSKGGTSFKFTEQDMRLIDEEQRAKKSLEDKRVFQERREGTAE